MKIFVSYSRKDSQFTDRLVADLNERGLKTWQDKRDIPTGHEWDIEVQTALQDCTHMLVVLSPASMTSKNVLDEISYFLKQGRPIFPVQIKP